VNSYSIVASASPSWSDSQLSVRGVISALVGSSLCDKTAWVACPTCSNADFPPSRVQTVNDAVMFLKNDCSITFEYVVVDYLTILFISVAFFFMRRFMKQAEVRFDEAHQTASDYSLTVRGRNGPRRVARVLQRVRGGCPRYCLR